MPFISARFKVRVKVIEVVRHPTSEPKAQVGFRICQLIQAIEQIFLSSTDGDTTELRVRVNVDIFGRLGIIGFNVLGQRWISCGANSARIYRGILH